VGDSITQGVGASSSSASYPSVLQKLLGSAVQVGNFGHSGATLLSTGDLPYQKQTEYTAATTFVSGAGASAVVDVIIMLGTNDSKSYNWMNGTATRAQQYVTDLTALVDHFATLSTHPLVYLALPPRAFTNTYGISGTLIHDQILPLIQQVAATKGLPVIDVDTPTASQSALFPDGVHPNDKGYMLLAQVMHDGLLQAAGGKGGTSGQGGAGGRAGGAGHAGGGAGGAAGAGGMVGAGGMGGGQATGGAGAAGASGRGGAGGGGQLATGGTGTGGTSSAGGSGGSRPSGSGGSGPLPGTGGSGSGGATSGSGGSTGPSNPGAGDGGGCSCRLPGDAGRHPAAAALLLAALALVLRRRR
jgi:MYXO-CTERM domain-containing protein